MTTVGASARPCYRSVAAVAAVRAAAPLEILPVQGNVFVLFGPGGNTTVQIGPEGPLVVDAQPAALSERCSTAIRSLTPRPIRHIVLTNGDEQAAGGAANLSKAGRYVRVIDSIDPRGADTRASIIAHLNVLNRMSAAKAPSDIWPTDTYFTRSSGRSSPMARRCASFMCRPRTPTATRSCSSAAPT